MAGKLLPRLLTVILTVTLLAIPMSLCVSAAPSTDGAEVSVNVNGRMLYEKQKFLIDSTTYVPIRDFCNSICDCEVEWNAKSRTASIDSYECDITAKTDTNYIIANGRYLYNEHKIIIVNDKLCIPIRTLAKAYGLDVSWNANTKTATVTGKASVLKSGDRYYNSTDLYWLSRIINAESSGEPLLGKIAVGNVVQNRVSDRSYPNTIYGVIFDRKFGTQFSPVASGTIYNSPSSESIVAAKICLEGYSINSDMLFFLNPKIATNFWIPQSRTYVMTIGNHVFYY